MICIIDADFDYVTEEMSVRFPHYEIAPSPRCILDSSDGSLHAQPALEKWGVTVLLLGGEVSTWITSNSLTNFSLSPIYKFIQTLFIPIWTHGYLFKLWIIL